MNKKPKYIMKPKAQGEITVYVYGRYGEMDHGSQPLDHMMTFESPLDFLAWLDIALRAMENKEYIELEHYSYHYAKVIPEKIILAGQIKSKPTRCFLNSSTETEQ